MKLGLLALPVGFLLAIAVGCSSVPTSGGGLRSFDWRPQQPPARLQLWPSTRIGRKIAREKNAALTTMSIVVAPTAIAAFSIVSLARA